VVGVINLYSATSVARGPLSDDYVQQIYWLVAGGILATVVAAIDYRHYERLGYVLYAWGVVLLLLVFILGRDIRGSSRWIYIGSLQLSAERVHEALSRHRARKVSARRPEERGANAEGPGRPGAHRGRSDGLVLLQPDLGTALIRSRFSFRSAPWFVSD
jgi:rod shape determining protein RodA